MTDPIKELTKAMELIRKDVDSFQNEQLDLIEKFPDDYKEVTAEDFCIFFSESF